jgi:hypothetical protein
MNKKTFCPLPWTHLATHPHGSVTLCCESDMTNRNSDSYNIKKEMIVSDRDYQTLHSTNYSFEKIMNSDLFSEVRKKMLNGEMPSQCKKCFEYEKNGLLSKRNIETERLDFSYEDAIKITNSEGKLTDINFEFIELRLGNHCNLACRTCNPSSSTRWIKDYEKLTGNSVPISQENFDWPLDDKFWEALFKHSHETKIIYINGGEPFLIDKHYNYLKYLADNGYAKNIQLFYSTNCTVKNNLYIDIWKYFKKVHFWISIDDINQRNEYLRSPSSWETVTETFNWFLTLKNTLNNVDCSIMQTVSIMNIFYLKEFYEYFKKYNINISLNFVHDPYHYNAIILPKKLKDRVIDKHKNYPFVDLLINYFSDVENKDFHLFLKYNSKLDNIRKQSFEKSFKEWYNILQEYENEI